MAPSPTHAPNTMLTHDADTSTYHHDNHSTSKPLVIDILIGAAVFCGIICVLCTYKFCKKYQHKILKKLKLFPEEDVNQLEQCVTSHSREHLKSNLHIHDQMNTNPHYSNDIKPVPNQTEVNRENNKEITQKKRKNPLLDTNSDDSDSDVRNGDDDSDSAQKKSSSDDSIYRMQHQYLTEEINKSENMRVTPH